MELQTLNAMYENLYSFMMLMIQYVTLIIIGSVSVLFMIICLAGAAVDCVKQMTGSARRLLKPATGPMQSPKLDAHDVPAVPAGIESYIQ